MKSPEKEKLLFEFSPIPIWIYEEKTLRITDANHACLDLYGYSRKEFLTMTILDLFDNDDIGRLKAIVVLSSNHSYDHLVGYDKAWKHRDKKGKSFFIQADSNPYHDGEKKLRIVYARIAHPASSKAS